MFNPSSFYSFGASGVNLNTNLVTYYKLESDVTDSIGTQNGTIIGSPTFVTGKVGNAVNFINDAANNYLNLPDNNAFSFTSGGGVDLPFSISLWFNVTAFSSFNFLVNKQSATGFEWQLLLNGSTNILFSKFTNTSISQGVIRSSSISLNTWHHLVVTDNGSKTNAGMKVYLNGVLGSNTNSNSGVYTGMANTTSPVFVGNFGNSIGTANKHKGLLDELGIWKNRELTSAEITFLYNSGNGRTYPF